MDYEKSRLLLRYGLLIDLDFESFLLDETAVHENPEKIIGILLWKTVYQCNEYFITDDFFGSKPPNGEADFSRHQLVTALDEHFDYLQRRIIIENIAMDLYLSLGREIHAKETITEGTKYLTLFPDRGYYQMNDGILTDSYKIENTIFQSECSRQYPDNLQANNHPYETAAKKRSRQLSTLLKSKYIKECREKNQPFDEFVQRFDKSPEEKNNRNQIPVFDCRLIAAAVLNIKTINYMHNILKENDDNKKLEMINGHRASIRRLEFSNNDSPKPEINAKFLDDNIYHYCLEKYLHGRLQHEVLHICNKLSEEYNLKTNHLQSTLIDTVNMNVQFGIEYLLEYPLQYIYNPTIQADSKSQYQDHKSYHVNENVAETIWVDKYCKYIETLSYVIIPIVRTTFELNLYEYCKSIYPDKDREAITKIMFGLLEEYEKCNSECVTYDFSSLHSEVGIPPYKPSYLHVRGYTVDDCITEFLELKDKCHFEKAIPINLPNIRKQDYLSHNLITKIYDIWYNPENFQSFFHKIMDEKYYDINNANDAAMDYYKRKIIETRTESIIVKHSREWKKK